MIGVPISGEGETFPWQLFSICVTFSVSSEDSSFSFFLFLGGKTLQLAAHKNHFHRHKINKKGNNLASKQCKAAFYVFRVIAGKKYLSTIKVFVQFPYLPIHNLHGKCILKATRKILWIYELLTWGVFPNNMYLEHKISSNLSQYCFFKDVLENTLFCFFYLHKPYDW